MKNSDKLELLAAILKRLEAAEMNLRKIILLPKGAHRMQNNLISETLFSLRATSTLVKELERVTKGRDASQKLKGKGA